MTTSVLRPTLWSTLARCKTCRYRRSLLFSASASASFHTSSTVRDSTSEAQVPKKRGRGRKTLEQPVPESWSRNLLEETKIETYLASLSDQAAISLEDIERHKPSTHAPPSSPQYEEDYNNLLTQLCASFSKKQLKQLGEMYGLDAALFRTTKLKVEYAVAIIENQWDWPSLKEVKRHNELWTTYDEISLPVTPIEMFFIIGKDGSELLSLASRHKVHVSLSSNPLQLRIEGIKGELEKVMEHITRLKSGIVEQTFEIPTKEPIRPDLVQRVSRLANAYIQNIGNKGTIRICAKDNVTLSTAYRLTTRAACQLVSSSTPLMAYLPPTAPPSAPVPISLFPQMYSMYPFTPARSLPWSTSAQSVFRVRKVGEWLNESNKEEGGLAHGSGKYLTLSSDDGDIRKTLIEPLQMDSSGVTTVTATLGHILMTPIGALRPSLIPPLQGTWLLAKILKFLSNNTSAVKQIFIPSLPAAMLNSVPSEQNIIHRLEYQALSAPTDYKAGAQSRPAKMIKWQVDLNQAASISSEEAASSSETSANKDEEEGSLPEQPSQLRTLPTICHVGNKTDMHLLLPDRPMDILLEAFNSTSLAEEDSPRELVQYKESLQSFLSYTESDATQPSPPLTLRFKGEIYILTSTTSVRQSNEQVPIASSDHKVAVLSESVLDLESTQKSTTCQVQCNKVEDDLTWNGFLGDCDDLTKKTKH